MKNADKSVLGTGSRSEPVFHVSVTERHYMTSTSKRDESTSIGLVFDYLWDQGAGENPTLASDPAVAQGDDWGSEIENWMEENSRRPIAPCFSS